MALDRIVFGCHRLSWQMMVGEIPDGLHVLHKCDFPSCVNPDHLFLGTHHENMTDRASKCRTHNLLGEPKSHHRLKADQVQAIRTRYANSSLGLKEVATEFEVSTSTVGLIIKCKKWKDVPWPSDEMREAARAKASSRFRMGRTFAIREQEATHA